MWNMFKVNNKDTRTTPMALIVNSSVSIVNFEDVITGWEAFLAVLNIYISKGSCKWIFQANTENVKPSLVKAYKI